MQNQSAVRKTEDMEASSAHTQDVQTMALTLARKVALAHFPRYAGPVAIYDVPRGWVTAVLRDDPAVAVPEMSFDLYDYLNRPDVETILVPDSFTMNRAMVERMCGVCGVQKTVFIEVGDE